MKIKNVILGFVALMFLAGGLIGQQASKPTKKPKFDASLAKKLGADKLGMKHYVLAILKTGPAVVAPGKERDEIFKGHFANMARLADDGKLVVAGPFEEGNDWRGLFIFNVETIEEARKLTETDPVVKSGVMVVEFHKWYGSAALMQTTEIHKRIAQENP